MRKISLIPFYLMAVLLVSGQIVCGQNLYIEILDVANYRSLANVRVELKSAQANITFYSSPRGEVIEYVPAGFYSVTFSRSAYETQYLEEVEILSHDVTTLSIFMHAVAETPPRQEKADLPTQPETVDQDRPIISTIPMPSRNFILSLGYQFGNIQTFHASLGVSTYKNLIVSLGVGYGQQAYQSSFFIDPATNYQITFTNILLGMGYDFIKPLNQELGLFLFPSLTLGGELVQDNNLIGVEGIDYMINAFLKPEIRIGFYYNKLNFFMGINYSEWILKTINEKRIIIENGLTGEALGWSDDLFKDRKGEGIVAGIMINF